MERGASARTGSDGKPPGILATFADAVSALLVNPALLLVPVAVDAWLALGPRVSPAPLTDAAARAVAAQAATPGLSAFGSTPAELAAQIAALGAGDVVAVVGWLVPSLLAGADRAAVAGAAGRPVVVPGGPDGVVLVWLAAALVGIALVMLFRVLLARAVCERPLWDGALPAEAARAALRYLGFLALLAAAAVVAGLAAGVLLAVAAAVSPDLAALVGLLLTSGVIIVSVLIAFVAEAIALAGLGPVEATRLSVRVVRRHTWPAIGLILAGWLALLSLPDLLGRLTGGGLGLALAVLVYAFVATGVALARMQFLHDRLPAGRPPTRAAF